MMYNLFVIDLLKTLYNNLEGIKGKKLFYLYASVLLVSLVFGLIIGYFIDSLLNKNETSNAVITTDNTQIPQITNYQGKVVYFGEGVYPVDNIKYSLIDSRNKRVVLLRAKDERLKIVENLYVTVRGSKSTTSDGKDFVVDVEEVIVRNE